MKDVIGLFAVLVISLIGVKAASDCYECNYAKVKGDVYNNFLFSYLDDCGDPFKKDNITLSSCSNECYKAVVDIPTSNTRCVSRGCFPNSGCKKVDANEQFLLECGGKAYQPILHCCNGDKCNGGARLGFGLFVMVIGLMTTIFGL